MGAPVIYDAHMEQMREELSRLPVGTPAESIVRGDPIRSFEYEKAQKITDLRLWMTYTVEDRLVKTRNILDIERFAEVKNPDALRRDLNYIIWFEAIHPGGDRKVAALAFNSLFPERTKK